VLGWDDGVAGDHRGQRGAVVVAELRITTTGSQHITPTARTGRCCPDRKLVV